MNTRKVKGFYIPLFILWLFAGISCFSGSGGGGDDAPPEEQVLSAPLNLAAADGTETDRITISFIMVAGAESYEIFRSTAASGTYHEIGTTSSGSYNDTGVTAGITYYYKVRAYSAEKGYSEFSNFDAGYLKTVTSGHDVPENLSASDGVYSDYIHLTWSPVTDATGYSIYRSTSSNGVYQKIGSRVYCAMADTGISAGTTYYYKVAACFADGEGDTGNFDSGYRGAVTVPASPVNITATRPGSGSTYYRYHVRLSWSASANAASYRIYRSTASTGPFVNIGTAWRNSYDDYTCASDVDCYYRITAVSANGGESLQQNGYTLGRRGPSGSTSDSFEENDGSASGGTLLNTGDYQYRNIWVSSGGSDVDWFRFYVNNGRKYVIETNALENLYPRPDTELRVYTTKDIASYYDYIAIDDNGGEENFSRIVFTATRTGYHYCLIDSNDGLQSPTVDYFYRVMLIDSRAKVNIINDCDYEITELYYKVSTNPGWSANIIGTGSIKQESSRVYDIGPGVQTYDFRVVNSNGQVATTVNKEFGANTVFNWTLE